MVHTIEQAITWLASSRPESIGDDWPVLRYRTEPLVGLEQVTLALGLPAEFCDTLNHLAVENVQIGYFDLTPGESSDATLSIKALNDSSRCPVLPDDMVQVASFETEVIAVRSGAPRHPDSRVFLIDVGTGCDIAPTCIARTYADFLVLAVALHRLALEQQDQAESGITELAGTPRFSVPPAGIEAWRQMARQIV